MRPHPSSICLALLLAGGLAVGGRPAAANDLGTCGYHDLPLAMQQLPVGSLEYLENASAMTTYNLYMGIYTQYPFDGNWGRNGDNEFGGYPSEDDLNATWGFSWDGALAMTCTRWDWCECCEIYESDVVFNPLYTWTFDQEEALADQSKVFYQSVLLHELGHTWGLQIGAADEDYAYEHPTVMHAYVSSVLQDDETIHYPDAYLLRRQYDDQTSIPTMHNMVVTSKYAHPVDLTWRNTTVFSYPVLAGDHIPSIHDLTVENTGTEDLSNVHVRFYLKRDGDSPYPIGDFNWDTFPAESYGVFDFYNLFVPYDVPTGTYRVTAHVTHNGYQEDDRPLDSRTFLVGTAEIEGRSIEVTSPALNDVLTAGEVHTITWNEENAGDDVKIMISSNDGASWGSLASPVPNTGSYDWTVNKPPGTEYRVKIYSLDHYPMVNGVSDRFAIVGRYVEVEQPNGGEVLYVGSSYSIQWESDNIGDQVRLLYSCNGGGQYYYITEGGIPDNGFYVWTVPDMVSDNCLVRVKSVTYETVFDTSDAVFSIARSGVELTAPQTGDTWWVGSPGLVHFDYDGGCGQVEVSLRRAQTEPWTVLGTPLSSQSPFQWTVTGPATTTARVRVADVCNPEIYALSGSFEIGTRSIELTSPNGGEVWRVGEEATVTWDETGAGNTVNIFFTLDWGATLFDIIAWHEPNTGSYTFTVPATYAGSSAAVKIVGSAVTGIEDWSDDDFMVVDPTAEVVYPNGGETLVVGETRELTWTATDAGDYVRLYYRIAGGSWTSINGYTPNDGTYSWLVPEQPHGTQAEFRVDSAQFPDVSDVSDAPFTIGARSITVTSPAGGEVFDPGDQMTVRWTSELAGRDVTISESCDRGFTWTTIAARTDNDGSFAFTVVPPRREPCRIMVRSWLFNEVRDLSTGYYEIANSPPVAVNDTTTTDEDHPVSVDVLRNDDDPDGDELNLLDYSQPGHGRVTVDGHTGNLVYEPSHNFNGDDTFTYRVEDGHGGHDQGAVLITVNPVNDDPVAVDDQAEVGPGTTTIHVLTNDYDVDGDPLTIFAMSSAQHGHAAYSNNTVTYTPDAGYQGDDSFQYAIMDGAGGDDTAMVYVTVSGGGSDLFADDFESGDTSAWSALFP